jgi:WhiB family redox-sensing transcriptional regulator
MTRARMPRPHEVAAARRDPRLLRAVEERSDGDMTWRTRGVCQSVDPEVFFPAPSEPADAAIALCRTCPVQGSCLAWALQAGDLHGVWGGTTARERRAMAVVWQGGRHQLVPEPPAAPLDEPSPDELATVGTVMDRDVLLRLVKTG